MQALAPPAPLVVVVLLVLVAVVVVVPVELVDVALLALALVSVCGPSPLQPNIIAKPLALAKEMKARSLVGMVPPGVAPIRSASTR
jgi:hypothetical protein